MGGLLWWKRLASGNSVVLVVNPLLSDGVSDTQHRPAENLAPERARVNDRTDVGDAEERTIVYLPVSRSTSTSAKPATKECVPPSRFIVVARDCHQSLACESFGRGRGHLVDSLGRFVAVVNAAQFDGALGCFREGHAASAAPA